jgi:hypothetical protein
VCSGEIHPRLVLQVWLGSRDGHQQHNEHLMAQPLIRPATSKNNIQLGGLLTFINIINSFCMFLRTKRSKKYMGHQEDGKWKL